MPPLPTEIATRTKGHLHASSSLAFHHAKPPLRRPRLDNQQRRLRVQAGDDDLGNVGKKQVSSRPFTDGSGQNRPPGDLRLTWPPGLLALLRVRPRTMQGEPRIPSQIRTLARARHRPEPELTVGELALDARDPRRAVGPQRRDRLVPARVEEPPYPRRELGLRRPRPATLPQPQYALDVRARVKPRQWPGPPDCWAVCPHPPGRSSRPGV